MGHLKGQDADRGWMWFAAPLLVCLPCLAPFLLGAVLTGVGIGAAGSFLTDNGFLIAIITAAAIILAFTVALGFSRLLDERRHYADEHH
ncbi:MAG: hypothetical protein IH957_02755 [Chloroflexi bacterium]|nr:hypothetical protein [Chloroflexota bacterium]